MTGAEETMADLDLRTIRRILERGIRVHIIAPPDHPALQVEVTSGTLVRNFSMTESAVLALVKAAQFEGITEDGGKPPPDAVGMVELLRRSDGKRTVPVDDEGSVMEEVWDGEAWVPSDQQKGLGRG